MSVLTIIVIVLALGFDLLNGMNDSSNIVAPMISSRAVRPRIALTMTAIAEFCGPFIFGVAVATTIGHEIVAAEVISIKVLIAALVAAICWNMLARTLGFPSSSSHALIGGFIGSVMMAAGWQSIKLSGLTKVVVSLFASPIIGIIIGFLVLRFILILTWNASPRVNGLFRRGQILTGIALALSHGANDAQKSMGIITLALLISGQIKTFQVPTWVILACAGAIAIGTSIGSWRLIRTLGGKFYKIKPVDGFASQLSSALVILTASLLGGPVSTSQVVSSAIMGVGSAERLSKVRWGVAGEIATAWLLTIPSTALVGSGVYWLLIHLIP